MASPSITTCPTPAHSHNIQLKCTSFHKIPHKSTCSLSLRDASLAFPKILKYNSRACRARIRPVGPYGILYWYFLYFEMLILKGHGYKSGIGVSDWKGISMVGHF